MRYLSPGMPTSRVRGTGPGWCIGFRLGFSFEEEWGSSSMGIRFQGLHCFDRREHVIAYSDEFGWNPSKARNPT